jgi:hypothetical protein
MGFIACVLPHPLVIILTVRCLETAEKDYPGLPFPQNAAEVEEECAAWKDRLAQAGRNGFFRCMFPRNASCRADDHPPAPDQMGN